MTLRYALAWILVTLTAVLILLWPVKGPAQTPAQTQAPAKAAAQTTAQAPVKAPTSPTSAAASPTPARSKFVPSLPQSKDLRIAQLEAVTAQQTYAMKAQTLPEYQQFQQAMNRLVQECNRVKAENKWPAQVECDVNSNPVVFGEKK